MQAFEFAKCLKLMHLHTSQSTQTDSSSHQQQQTVSSPNPLLQADPEYEEVIELSENRNRHGGGVLIFISNIFIHRVIFRSDHELELLIVSVSNHFGRCVCLGVLYRPPDAGHLILDCVSDVLCRIDSNLFSNFILLGDFNIDFNNTNHPFYNQLTSFLSSFSFTQVVSSPTRVTPQSCTLIDLALVSELSLVYSCDILPPLANSDHYGVILQLRTHKV